MAVNLAAIRDLLLPGLMSVGGKYKTWPNRWSKVYTTKKSKMTFERNAQMRFLGLGQIKEEGQPTFFDNNAGERWMYVQEHFEVSLGYAITSKTIEDNLYESQFEPSNLGLNRSFAITKEIFGANVFNNGTTVGGSGITGGDGVALFSTAHPYDNGTWANLPTNQIDLSETALLNAAITINSTFVDEAGLLADVKAKTVMIPPALEPVLARLVKTELRPGTNNNDINVIPIVAGGIDSYFVNPYLTSNFGWFVLTDVEAAFLYLDRIPYETSMWVDNSTDNLLVKGRERYSFGYREPRGAYASFPTS